VKLLFFFLTIVGRKQFSDFIITIFENSEITTRGSKDVQKANSNFVMFLKFIIAEKKGNFVFFNLSLFLIRTNKAKITQGTLGTDFDQYCDQEKHVISLKVEYRS